ncbi:UNVERIFIED_ORG: transposase [Rahnella aquatilis]
MPRYDLPGEAWTIIQSLLPLEPATSRVGRPWAQHRMIINGMFWVLCSGALWRDLSKR